MKVASVSELKNQMSRFLKQAQKEDIIVTSRGKPIALISGLSSNALEDYSLVSDEELKYCLEDGIKAADKGKFIDIEDLISKIETAIKRKRNSAETKMSIDEKIEFAKSIKGKYRNCNTNSKLFASMKKRELELEERKLKRE
jgi:prevent-host-death family protein